MEEKRRWHFVINHHEMCDMKKRHRKMQVEQLASFASGEKEREAIFTHK